MKNRKLVRIVVRELVVVLYGVSNNVSESKACSSPHPDAPAPKARTRPQPDDRREPAAERPRDEGGGAETPPSLGNHADSGHAGAHLRLPSLPFGLGGGGSLRVWGSDSTVRRAVSGFLLLVRVIRVILDCFVL